MALRRPPARAHARRLALLALTAALGASVAPAAAAPTGAGSPAASVTPGTVFGTGNNPDGDLGIGSTDDPITKPTAALFGKVIQVAHGNGWSMALRSDGTVWTTGLNTSGQLGTGAPPGDATSVPVKVPSVNNIVAIAAGQFHALVLRSDGVVMGWGGNGTGQLIPASPVTSFPTSVNVTNGMTAIAAGGHSLAIDAFGAVYAWGANGSGQLGNGSTSPSAVIAPVAGLSGVVSVAAGSAHSMALKSDGTVWAWGDNTWGQIGVGTTGGTVTPPEQVLGITTATAIASGGFHSLARLSNGTVRAWGFNGFGQIGDNSTTPRPNATPVSGLTSVVSVAGGNFQSAALRSDGSVWGWGSGGEGELGTGKLANSPVPVQMSTIGRGGTALAAGYASANTMVIAQPVPSASPTRVSFGDATPVGSSGPSQTVTFTNIGAPMTVDKVEPTGGDADQFGITSDGCTNQSLVSGATCAMSVRFTPVAAGAAAASLTFRSDAPAALQVPLRGYAAGGPAFVGQAAVPGPALAWGNGAAGQLGSGGIQNLLVPKPTSGPPTVVAVSAGGSHTATLRSDGRVWSTGLNSSGQLGDGSGFASLTPVVARGLSGVVAIDAAADQTLALRGDGTVWAWGHNLHSDLGDGSTTNRTTPIPVTGLANIVAIATGGHHGLALRGDGTVWSWGYNQQGQLGKGSTTPATTPIQVPGLAGVVAIAAGDRHSLALRSDGTLRGWGENDNGELGIGNDTTPQTVPVAIPVTNATAIAGGGHHSLAVVGGTVRTWGLNGNGQLGNNSTTRSLSPVALGAPTGVADVDAGQFFSLALKADGTAWSWGQNASGQLGNNSISQSLVPVQIGSLGHGAAALAAGPLATHSVAIGQPYVGLSATKLTFAAGQPVGSPTAAQRVTVTNNGAAPLTIGGAAIVGGASGADGDEFSMSGDGCSNTTLAPNGTCAIGIRFKPIVAGAPIAYLRIPSTSPTTPNLVTLDPPADEGVTAAATQEAGAAAPVLGASLATAAIPAPAAKAKTKTALATCARARLKRQRVSLTCTLAGRGALTAKLVRGRKVYASGRTTLHAGRASLRLKAQRKVRRGIYTLVLSWKEGRSTVVARRTVLIS